MARLRALPLLLGVLLLSAPLCRAQEEGDEEFLGDEEVGELPEGAYEAQGEEEEDFPFDEKDVVVLTASNFTEAIKSHKFVLAEFYAPWCGHCKALAPHYAAAATQLKALEGTADVVIAKVDGTIDSELAEKFGVEGYPTLKWFVEGEAQEYTGPRETEGIVAWVQKKSGPPTVTVSEVAALTDLEQEAPAIAVGYFTELAGAEYEAFKALALKTEDVAFVDTTSAAVAKQAGLTAAPGVAIVKNFKGEARSTVAFAGSLAGGGDALKQFITAEKLPLVIEFNQENGDRIFSSGLKLQVLLWAPPADLAPGSQVFDAFKAVAAEFKGKLVFVTVDNTGADHEPVTNFFGLEGATAPQVVGFFMENNNKYKLKEAFSQEAVKAFVAGVLDGTAEADFKSAPIPENNKDGDVTVVVGKTVEDVVFDDSRDVLLEVYAPWCGHCQELEPTYKKLATRFKNVDSVVIAKMDGTENEHPALDVQGFPSLFFIPAGGNEVLPYDGDNTLKAFTEYIKENAKLPFTLPEEDHLDDDDAPVGTVKDEL